MSRKTLAQSIQSVKSAQLRLEREKNQARRIAMRVARETAALERKVQRNRALLTIALPDIAGPNSLMTSVDQLIEFSQQRHVHKALREHAAAESAAAPAPASISSRVVRKKHMPDPSHKNPDTAPVYDHDALYHVYCTMHLWDDKSLVLSSDRLDPVWFPEYYTGANNENGPFGGYWTLPHHKVEHELERRAFNVYQDMWRSHQFMPGWSFTDPYWALGSYNESGCFCTAPKNRILIADDTNISGCRYIGRVNSDGVIEIADYGNARQKFGYLDGHRVDSELFELDRLILG